MAEEAAPLGLLEAAAPPELPVLLAEEPPAPELLVPPVPPGLELADESGVLDEAELEELGAGAVAVVEEEDEPPGTTTVSFSFVTLETGGLPPGTTVVVSLRSHAERASVPAKIKK